MGKIGLGKLGRKLDKIHLINVYWAQSSESLQYGLVLLEVYYS